MCKKLARLPQAGRGRRQPPPGQGCVDGPKVGLDMALQASASRGGELRVRICSEFLIWTSLTILILVIGVLLSNYWKNS